MAVTDPDSRERLPDGRPRVAVVEPNPNVRVAVEQVWRGGVLRDPVDRRGRLKTDQVRLVAVMPPARPVESLPLIEADWLFVLGARRRSWSAISRRFGGGSQELALALVEAGVVELGVPNGLHGVELSNAQGWFLTSTWVERARLDADARTTQRADARVAATELAQSVDAFDPGLSAAIRVTPSHQVTFAVLTAAAQDLLDGVSHDGPRAFSQVHFGHTKARDDAPQLLRAAGVADTTLDALGLSRSPYLGLGGALHTPLLDLVALKGPVRLRAVDTDHWKLALTARARALVLVENLQAAEAVCDMFEDVAVIWFAGQPGDAVLRACQHVAAQAARSGVPILVAPDADLGGVYMTKRLVRSFPAGAQVRVVDAGQTFAIGDPSRPFTTETRRALRDLSDDDEPVVRTFAAAVLKRGHPIEQEAAVRAGVMRALTDLNDPT